MADLDLARVKRNVAKLVDLNAPEADIDAYIAEEGTTVDAVRAIRIAPAAAPGAPPEAASGASSEDGIPDGDPRFETIRRAKENVANGVQPSMAATPFGPRHMDFDPAGVDPATAAPSYGGLGMNATAGLNDAIYGTLGAPVDAMAGAMNMGVRGVNAVAGTELPTIDEPFGGSRSIGRAMGAVAAPLDPANTKADTAGERVARGVGQGVAGTVLPAALASAALRTGVAAGPTVTPLMEAMVGRSGASVAGAAGDAFAGAAAGAGAAGAMEASPDSLKPIAGLAGGMIGGGLGAAAAGIPGLAREGGRLVGRAVEPFTQAGQQQRASRTIREGASDPQSILDADVNAGELVRGSRPTTGQLTGDMGVLAMERGSQTRFPAEFGQRRADQNAARVGALAGVQPTGAPEKVTQSIRSFLKTIDDDAEAAIGAATESARASAARVGAAMRPDEAGATMRASLETARSAAKSRERALWSAVDPDGTLALSAGATKRQAGEIVKELPASAKPPTGEEAAILDVLGRYGDVVPFSELSALSSRLKSEMRAERMTNGETPAYRRMSQLSAALHQDLETAVAGKVRFEAKEVAAGRMAEADTMEARWLAKTEEWLAEREQARAAGFGSGAGPITTSRGRSAAVSSQDGTGRQTIGQSGGSSGNSRLSPDAGGQGEGFRPVSLTELKSLGADDPYFVRTPDGQSFVPRVLGNGGERTPDLGTAPDLEAPGRELPIRIRRSDMVKHVGNDVHQNDARALGYGDSWDMVQDIAASWSRMRKGRYGRVQLVKPAQDGNGVAVVELAPSDDTTYWRVVSAHRNRDDQLGEPILAREHTPGTSPGNDASLVKRSPQGRQEAEFARDRISPEYTADGAPGQAQAFDGAALDRLNAARGATRERVQTFDNASLAPLRQRNGVGDYKVMDASVAGKIFFGQPKSAEAISQFRRAVGDNEALAAIEPYAVDLVRRAALRDDGTFEAARLNAWRRQHQDALRAFPDLDTRLADAGRAAETTAEVAVTRRQAAEAEHKGALGKLVGIESPEEVTRAIGSLFGRQDGPSQLANVKRAIGGDAAAMEGLRKAVADHIAGRLVGNTEVGTSGVAGIKADQYQTFVRQNRPLLRVVFTENEIRAMDAVAADLQRSNRSIAAVRIPGQSNTAQDTLAVHGGDAPTTVLAKILGASVATGGGVGAATGSLSGALVGAGTIYAGILREAGLRKIDELVRDALLDPRKAQVLLQTVKPSERAKELGLARRFRAAVLASGVMALQGDEKPAERRGPISLTVGRPRPPLTSGNSLVDALAARGGIQAPVGRDGPLEEALAARGGR